MSIRPRNLALLCASTVLALTTGCGISNTTGTTAISSATVKIAGHAHGGQQPISGATIQLYAVNTTTLKGASSALMPTPATTLADGSFSITGQYTCPVGDALVYIVATGGNPGLAGNGTNSSIAMMSLLGSCSNLQLNASTTFIWIDELTTVAAVQVLAPFMTDYAHVGSTPTGVNGVGSAFATAADEIDFSTGQFGFRTNSELPFVTLNTLADIIGACTNSPGSSTQCSTLFSKTNNATDTVGATLYMIQNPASNTTALYQLIGPASPFQPYLNTVPTDFSTTIGYALPSKSIQGGVLDSNGHIWLYYAGYNYSTATNTSTESPGYITVYDNFFNPLFTVNPGTGGLNYPYSFSADASGHVFALNGDNSVSEFDSLGNPVLPSPSPTGQPSTFVPTATGNTGDNFSESGFLAVDSLNNIWGAVDSQATGCYFQLNSSRAIATPADTSAFCNVIGTNVTTGAVDGSGDLWAVGSSAIAKVNSAGVYQVSAPASQGCFYTAGNFSVNTSTVLYDHSHNQLWGYSYLGAGVITNAGTAVACNFGATMIPAFNTKTATSTTPGAVFSNAGLLISNAVLDGAGNLWFATGGVSASGVNGPSSSPTNGATFSGTLTYSTFLGEISSAGTLVTPNNAATGSYGYQPQGFGANGTAAATDVLFSGSFPSASLLGVDASGNIWAIDSQTYRLLKIPGMASPNTINY